jgi:pilus assembly protein CpaC
MSMSFNRAASRKTGLRHQLMLGAMALGLAVTGMASLPEQAQAQASRASGTTAADLLLSVGRGRLVTLPTPMTDVFVANQSVADVQVRSSTQLYIFGKGPGETSIYATDAAGRVVYSVVARVGNNIETIDQMLALAMPDANINVNTMNGFVLLTGTVAAPEDAAEADRLVTAFVGDGTRVLSRLQTATPLQVNLQVRIAEVNKSIIRQIGGNLLSRDGDQNGIIFGAFRGRNTGSITPVAPQRGIDPLYNPTTAVDIDPQTGCAIARCGQRLDYTINALADAATIGLGGRLFGLDLLGTLDLAERTGLVATLAQPNLTTISGETADFLAGGEYPIPVPDPLTGSITIQYRRFGVSLAYTPTVLSNGRISMRVRPEVSELSSEGAIRLQGIDIPALSVRRAETTVELGSGESFMIAGLMSNRTVGAIDRTPGLGDVPVLGSLFKSDSFRRGDTELVIVITPYLVRPVNPDQIVLPTDGYQNPTDLQRFLFNRTNDGTSGQGRPMPTIEQGDPATAPGVGGGAPSAALPAPSPVSSNRSGRNRDTSGDAAPGFSSGL